MLFSETAIVCKFREEFCKMSQSQLSNNITQFELSNQLMDCNLFEKIKLTASAKLVLIVLCRYYPKIYPCQKTIAKKAGLSLRSVINAISELKQKGVLLVECNYSNTYKFTNLFFELAEIAHSTRKICTKHDEKFAPNKQTNNKNIKKASKNNFSFKSQPEGIKILKADETILQYKKEQKTACSPMDDRQCAIDFLANINPQHLKQNFIRQRVDKIKAKWNLT